MYTLSTCILLSTKAAAVEVPLVPLLATLDVRWSTFRFSCGVSSPRRASTHEGTMALRHWKLASVDQVNQPWLSSEHPRLHDLIHLVFMTCTSFNSLNSLHLFENRRVLEMTCGQPTMSTIELLQFGAWSNLQHSQSQRYGVLASTNRLRSSWHHRPWWPVVWNVNCGGDATDSWLWEWKQRDNIWQNHYAGGLDLNALDDDISMIDWKKLMII